MVVTVVASVDKSLEGLSVLEGFAGILAGLARASLWAGIDNRLRPY